MDVENACLTIQTKKKQPNANSLCSQDTAECLTLITIALNSDLQTSKYEFKCFTSAGGQN